MQTFNNFNFFENSFRSNISSDKWKKKLWVNVFQVTSLFTLQSKTKNNYSSRIFKATFTITVVFDKMSLRLHSTRNMRWRSTAF